MPHNPAVKSPLTAQPHNDLPQPLRITVEPARQQQAYQVQVVNSPGKDWWDKAPVIINSSLGLVGLASLIVAGRTLHKLGEQIKAAMRDTEAMIRAERAWLSIEVTQQEQGVFIFRAKNVGKTPANILSVWTMARYYDRNEKFELPPDVVTEVNLLSITPGLLPSGATSPLLTCRNEAFEQQSGGGEPSNFARGFGSAYISGRIRYENVLSDVKTVHETRFVYWHIPVGGWVPSPSPHHRELNTFT